MRISIDLSSVRRTTALQCAIRFLLGGMITAVAGEIANKFGPAAGGLFLAFPAIFPATATLVEKHEIEKKQTHALRANRRGRQAAAVDAAGTAIGSLGLFGFAIFVEHFVVKQIAPWAILLAATLLWLAISGLLWRVRMSGMLRRLKSSLHLRQVRAHTIE